MHQFARLALRWNEIEPSPGGQTVRPKPQDARRNGIAAMMIEEKPAIDFCGAKLRLDGLNVRHDASRPLSWLCLPAPESVCASLPQLSRASCGFCCPKRF